LCNYSFGQNNTTTLWESKFNLNGAFSDKLSFNTGIEYRSVISTNFIDEPIILDSQHIQIGANLGYKVGFYGNIGGGVMYRVNKLDSNSKLGELRLTQQYSVANRFYSLRIVHRLKTDQRIFRITTLYRFRYRISADFPLSGLKLDPGEFYMVASTESILNVFRRIKPEWDQRFVVGVGNQINKRIKLQLDTEYRLEAYNIATEKRLFLATNFIYRW
jgi:hypothetical protein